MLSDKTRVWNFGRFLKKLKQSFRIRIAVGDYFVEENEDCSCQCRRLVFKTDKMSFANLRIKRCGWMTRKRQVGIVN